MKKRTKGVNFLNPREARAANRAKRSGTSYGPKVATLDATGTKIERVDPACSVCREPVGSGGRKTAPALCARCYQRERRGLPPAPRSSAEARSESVTFQTSKRGRELLEVTARQLGVTVSTLVDRFVVDGLERLPL